MNAPRRNPLLPRPGRVAGLLGAVLAGVLCCERVNGESLSETVDRFAHPTLAGTASNVQGMSLRVGHLSLQLKQGVATPVLAGGDTIGFFFRGAGSWQYVSEAPEEFAVLANNANEISHWKPVVEKSRVVVSDEFSELLWISAGTQGLALGGGEAAAPAAEFKRHLDKYAKIGTASEGFAQRLTYRALSASSKPLAWGEFTGGKNETLFLYDAVRDDGESLSVLKKIDAPGYKIEGEYEILPVSEQPISHRFRETAPVTVGLSRVEADIEADGETAKIRTRETFVAVGEPLRILRLDLRSAVWEPGQPEPHLQRLLHVRSGSGKDLPFDHRRRTVLVLLPQEVAPGQSVTLEFEMGGNVLYRQSNDNYWVLGLTDIDWFPNPGFEASAFTWLCHVKVKKPFVPLASGHELERKTDGDWNILRTEIESPVSLPMVLGGMYKIHEDVRNGRTIRVAAYAFGHETAAKKMINLADQIIQFYEVFLGPFPWKEFTIIEIHEYGFGVAPPATMFITQEAFEPILADDATRLFSKGLNERYAHEIAHQYWGNQIKEASPEDQWLSESFAEYCAGLFIRRMRGDSAYRDLVALWRANAKDVKARATIPTANRILGEQAFRDRFYLLYCKGPYLLSVLHHDLGNEKFLTSLKTYQSNMKWRYGSTALTQDLFQFMAKKSYADFFDQYYWGTDVPDAPK